MSVLSQAKDAQGHGRQRPWWVIVSSLAEPFGILALVHVFGLRVAFFCVVGSYVAAAFVALGYSLSERGWDV